MNTFGGFVLGGARPGPAQYKRQLTAPSSLFTLA